MALGDIGRSPVGGAVTGMAGPFRVACKNLTTGQIVRGLIDNATWDCEALGLEVQPEDQVAMSVLGQAE